MTPSATMIQKAMERPKRFLFLMGYRGTGKTTIGKQLEAKLEMPWIDTDQQIESRLGRSIRDVFEKEGESHFRDEESKTLKEVLDGQPKIVSLGGGSILRDSNRDGIRQAGHVVWLQATPQEIYQRLKADPKSSLQRPALSNHSDFDEIVRLVESRAPIYEQMADLTISTTNRNAESIAEEIQLWWHEIAMRESSR